MGALSSQCHAIPPWIPLVLWVLYIMESCKEHIRQGYTIEQLLMATLNLINGSWGICQCKCSLLNCKGSMIYLVIFEMFLI